ncbi:molybdopterin-synthase adenylyltransferase MoeB [Aestuariibacter sp. AA17]|uniref:Molybdopterin-synthase adenylyltransferase MoeB n=1 Tax=Fluctibacter corallii TaxID=2984329 RepID=A0ABT3A409_9ALTE|nr:molybdopterin-synthase adenylyltransferase MoeB [Aestuariibacter sp. AA17]MCV2883355.1 molybdopterin-synthase adenylyltransferase MoeB [Aestuariibacter sp. AA17]
MSNEITQKQALRYNRQIVLPQVDLAGQEAILNAHVGIVGLGGLGCACAQVLAASGIGTLTLIDDDHVEITNISRQVLHLEADVGKAKVQSAAEKLVQINHDISLKQYESRLENSNIEQCLKGCDIIIDCSDNMATRQLINTYCVRQQRPLIVGAAIRFEGQISSFLPDAKSPCYHCMTHNIDAQMLSCTETGVLSPLVAIIGAMQAHEALRMLANIGQALNGRLLCFDGLYMEWREMHIAPLKGCPVCQLKQADSR